MVLLISWMTGAKVALERADRGQLGVHARGTDLIDITYETKEMFKYYKEVRRRWKASFGSVNDVLHLSGSKAMEVVVKKQTEL